MSDFAPLQPPFPWFGGKSKIAPLIWKRLGKVQHYVEPFFGSGAVMFANPNPPQVETVNDKDHMLANFWRATKYAPEAVADWADNPVNEDDLTARHIWLVKHGIPDLAARLPADPEYYDAKIAGWWVWGLCCWIGSGWCTGLGPWNEEGGVITKTEAAGCKRQLPHLGAGRGVNRQLPHLGDPGQGVNKENTDLFAYFQALAARLRYTRVCTGDWARIVTEGALSYGNPVGIFLDPPYSAETGRDMRLYREESADVAGAVLEWCKANGDNPRYRIALCGYAGEHDDLTGLGWTVEAWSANRAYGRANSETANCGNRHMERVWFSPYCVGHKAQPGLFA